jgi:hypothetical protein
MNNTTVAADLVRSSVYTAFLYGHGGPVPGEDWGVDLGRPLAYSTHRSVYCQQFARGIAVANFGDASVRVGLNGPYRDLTGVLRTVIEVPPHGADILVQDVRGGGPAQPEPRRDGPG